MANPQLEVSVKDAREFEVMAREARNLLAEMSNAYEALRGAVATLRDYPPDTVLGGNGVDALDEIATATDRLGGVLANYPDRQVAVDGWETEREFRRRWARKVLEHKRRIRELEALLAARADRGIYTSVGELRGLIAECLALSPTVSGDMEKVRVWADVVARMRAAARGGDSDDSCSRGGV